MNDDRMKRMRGATIRLVGGIILVDVVAFAVVGLTTFEEGNGRVIIGVLWLLATMAVILPGLSAVRRARKHS